MHQKDIDRIQKMDSVPRILDVVCQITGLGFAAITRVTQSHWVACAVKDTINFGLDPGGELDVETTICDGVRKSEKLVIFNDATTDPEYCEHPTPKMYGFKAYVSVPIFAKDGAFFGTLCGIDPEARKLDSPQIIETLRLFADLIGTQLQVQDQVTETEKALKSEKEIAAFRDQFIAVLAHDLRNPIAAIQSCVRLLRRDPSEEKRELLLSGAEQAAKRMESLVSDVMDFARSTFGVSIAIDIDEHELRQSIESIIGEIKQAHPQVEIQLSVRDNPKVYCDVNRAMQAVANLLSNAVSHGLPNKMIYVTLDSQDTDIAEISIENEGPPIPEDVRSELFRPFKRARSDAKRDGLGLGLFIVKHIADAHGGSVEYVRRNEKNAFILCLPIRDKS